MKKTLFILLFLSICKISFSQVWWNEFKDVDTSNYFFISDINGIWDTIYIDDLINLFGGSGLKPDSVVQTVDTLFIYYPDTTYKAAVIHPANLDNDPANELQTISTSGAAGNITLSGDGGTLNLNVNDADASTTNELQNITETTSFLSITGGSGLTPIISSSKDRPVNRYWIHTEGATFAPLISDYEDSWYLLNERAISVTNTCSANNEWLFNSADFGNTITDSCRFNFILSEGAGRTYNTGELHFVPTAVSKIDVTDSVKIRCRNNSDVWTTRYYGPFEIISGVFPYTYGRVVLSLELNYIREWEITFYGSAIISEIEFYYYRENLDLPIVLKSRENIFYKENTFYESLRDQYDDAGSAGQVLKSDGDLIYWDDEYFFDSTGIYGYVDSFFLVKDNYYYDRDDDIDISDTNEERVYDSYVENFGPTRTDNFNFPDFHNKERGFFANLTGPEEDYNRTNVYNSLYHFPGWNSVVVNENYIFKAYNDNIAVFSWDGHNIATGVYIGKTANKPFSANADFNLDIDENYLYKVADDKLLYYDIDTIIAYAISDTESSLEYEGFYQLFADYDYPNEISILNGVLYIAKNNGYIYRERIGVGILDTLDFTSYAKNWYSVEVVNDNLILVGAVGTGTAYYLDTLGATVKSHSVYAGIKGSHIYNNDLIYARSDNYFAHQWVYIGRDTTFTTLPEILDTSNYYSYSIEIEGNNVDTIRIGIATWLDGNVSYQWCTGDTLYTGWYRHELDFKPTLHDSIKPVFVIADTTSIRNVRLFLKQYQSESFDDSAIQERIDSVITIFVTHDTNDADTVIGNEYNTTLTLVGTELQLTDGGGTLTQELSSFLDNTDAQDLSLSVNTLSLTGDASTVDLSGYLDNTDAQTLSLVTNTLSISNGNSVSLAAYLDDTNLTQEEVQDYIGTMVTGNTETGITVTYDDANDEFDFIVTTVGESTTVGTGFDLSGYQIVADFNEFTTDISPEGDEYIIMYDVSGVTHEKIDIDDLATYIGGTDYYISDAFMSGDNLLFDMPSPLSNFSVDLSQFYDNTDDQQQMVNFSTYYRLGNESQSGTGISIIPGSGISITGTTGSSGSITISATGGSDGNGLWDSGNNNSLMAAGITGYVNNYMSFYNSAGTGSPILWIDDATTDYVAVGTSTQSNSAIFNVGGIVDIAGNTWIDGFLTLGTLSGTPTALLGKTSTGIVTDDLVLGDALVLTSGNLDVAIPWGRMSRSTSQTSTFAEVIPNSQTVNDIDVFTITGNRIEVDQAGDYEIAVSGWLSASGDGYYPQLLVRKNGSTTIINTVAYIETSASDKFSVYASDIVTLSALDEISMYISEIASTGNVTVEEAKMTIKKISD